MIFVVNNKVYLNFYEDVELQEIIWSIHIYLYFTMHQSIDSGYVVKDYVGLGDHISGYSEAKLELESFW